MSDVTIIIVNYNAGNKLACAVASVLECQAVKEILVVDNASKDDSLKAVFEIARSDGRISILQNSKNEGFAAACNRGMKAAKGDYLMILNPDCVVEAGAIETLLGVMQQNPDVGMAGPLLLNPDGTEQAGGRRAVPTPWRSFVRAFGMSSLQERYPKLFSDFILHHDPLPDRPVEVEAISGACMVVSQQAVDQIGMMDDQYFLHCEDLDWCMRFRIQGLKILFVPASRVVHTKGGCSKNRVVFIEWQKHKGMMRFYKKFFRHQYPGVLLWLVGAGVWLRFGMVAARHGVFSISVLLWGKSEQ